MQAARQLEFLVGKQSTKYNTYDLGDALGIAQHHDAVSGTAKQHTTNDYAKRLAIGAYEVPNKNFPNLKFENIFRVLTFVYLVNFLKTMISYRLKRLLVLLWLVLLENNQVISVQHLHRHLPR